MKKLKAALYPRVSHHDQVEFGFSLEAQKKHLIQLCEFKGYEIVDIYEDAGISAKNTNRPEFQRMIDDMREGKIDVIVCYKLDRLTRSLSDLDWLLKEMDKYNCNLVSASEDINTSTANGRFFIKIVILLAELELERTSERIKFVFEDKVKNGGAISGSQPIGYKTENGAVVIDKETEPMVRELFDLYEENHSLRRTVLIINEKYNKELKYTNISSHVKNTMYYGEYRNNPNYCPAYMTKERWEKINNIRKSGKDVKLTHTGRTYLFSRLVIDKNCNCKMVGKAHNVRTKYPVYSYNCNKYYQTKQCISNKYVNEKWLEQYMLDNFDKFIKDYFIELEMNYVEVTTKDNTKEIAKLKEELRRTTISFNKGRIEEDEYDKEWERINKRIKKLESTPTKKDVSHLEDLIATDWKTMYSSLTRENKSIFWRNVIDRIEIDPLNYKKGGKFIKVVLL